MKEPDRLTERHVFWRFGDLSWERDAAEKTN